MMPPMAITARSMPSEPAIRCLGQICEMAAFMMGAGMVPIP